LAPYAAAREVLQTGAADFAHNLQVEAEALSALETDASGHITHLFGSQVERIMLNFANPFAQTEDGERSSPDIPHPYLSDLRVRQAINLAVDRDTIAKELYGTGGKPTAQLLVAPTDYQSAEVAYTYDLEQAKALLDEAGWVDTNGDGWRDKDGVTLEVLFQTAVNPVRQKTQAIVSDSLKELGIDVQISRVRLDEFFSGDPQDTGSLNHFYADMQVYSIGNESPTPAPTWAGGPAPKLPPRPTSGRSPTTPATATPSTIASGMKPDKNSTSIAAPSCFSK
jgi:peptide/nickel transport system substrate-binding protein